MNGLKKINTGGIGIRKISKVIVAEICLAYFFILTI